MNPHPARLACIAACVGTVVFSARAQKSEKRPRTFEVKGVVKALEDSPRAARLDALRKAAETILQSAGLADEEGREGEWVYRTLLANPSRLVTKCRLRKSPDDWNNEGEWITVFEIEPKSGAELAGLASRVKSFLKWFGYPAVAIQPGTPARGKNESQAFAAALEKKLRKLGFKVVSSAQVAAFQKRLADIRAKGGADPRVVHEMRTREGHQVDVSASAWTEVADGDKKATAHAVAAWFDSGSQISTGSDTHDGGDVLRFASKHAIDEFVRDWFSTLGRYVFERGLPVVITIEGIQHFETDEARDIYAALKAGFEKLESGTVSGEPKFDEKTFRFEFATKVGLDRLRKEIQKLSIGKLRLHELATKSTTLRFEVK